MSLDKTIVVTAITGLVIVLFLVYVVGSLTRARVSRVFADFRNIGIALDLYYMDNGEYPCENDWEDELTPNYITSIAYDPFSGHTYRYYTDAAADVPGTAWLLVSDGPDHGTDVAEPGLSWVVADRVLGQLGGKDGATVGYGYSTWYNPAAGTADNGDLGRGGP